MAGVASTDPDQYRISWDQSDQLDQSKHNEKKPKTNQSENEMIDALISGKLIRTMELKTGQSGKHYVNFLLAASIGEGEPVIVAGIAFTETAERIARLQKGDSLAVIGGLKPSTWQDKQTNETKHGLSITVNSSLSPYDIQKRRKQGDEE